MYSYQHETQHDLPANPSHPASPRTRKLARRLCDRRRLPDHLLSEQCVFLNLLPTFKRINTQSVIDSTITLFSIILLNHVRDSLCLLIASARASTMGCLRGVPCLVKVTNDHYQLLCTL